MICENGKLAIKEYQWLCEYYVHQKKWSVKKIAIMLFF